MPKTIFPLKTTFDPSLNGQGGENFKNLNIINLYFVILLNNENPSGEEIFMYFLVFDI